VRLRFSARTHRQAWPAVPMRGRLNAVHPSIGICAGYEVAVPREDALFVSSSADVRNGEKIPGLLANVKGGKSRACSKN